ncbi:MAG: hypothetical protein QOD99_1037 [Chthoniobacter sp.]|jgi:hypothetical protein|nr:hypothetical protein [Chthoniobacter sp.]
MTKIHLRFLASAVVLLGLPLFLSRRPRVARRMILRGKPADIFPLINDLRNWPRWTEWSRREEMHFSYDGPPSGVGAVQRWSSARMDGSMRITHSVPDQRIAYDLDICVGKYRLEGAISLEPIGQNNTRVTWLCKWHASPNPYARYMDLLFKFWIGRDFERSLENLRALVKTEPALPALA